MSADHNRREATEQREQYCEVSSELLLMCDTALSESEFLNCL